MTNETTKRPASFWGYFHKSRSEVELIHYSHPPNLQNTMRTLSNIPPSAT